MHQFRWICFLPVIFLSTRSFSQASFTVTDPEKKYKEVKELMVKQDYAAAYPLTKELRLMYAESTASDHAYLNEDANFFYVLCELKLMQDVAVEDAEQFIDNVNNEPRRQMLSFHLGHYYFLKNDFASAIKSFDRAGYDNLDNEQIGEAKFEKAYSHFSLQQYNEAKPLFAEITQIPSNKYYFPANYYYGFIAYEEKQYAEALKSFKLVETSEEYKGVVPYYIAEIYYFQGKKDDALAYGESIVDRGGAVYNSHRLKLLLGQLAFEKKDYKRALPLLEAYVNNSPKVSKEVLYELSFCYYMENNVQKAIEGFKQLSNERDSMGQNSMYLLGDLYLKTNQKENARNAFQYSAFNNSNLTQQEVSRFNYAKLSYELGYQDIALNEMKAFVRDYPSSTYDAEAKEILVNLLANTNNFNAALELYETLKPPTAAMRKAYPRILYGRAIEFIGDQKLTSADELLDKVISNPESGSILPYANFWRGEIAYRHQRYDDAIRFLSIFLQSGVAAQGEATPAAARYNLGYSWFQKENYQNALSSFEQISKKISITSSAVEQDAYLRSADSYFMLRDFAKAGSMYDFVINNALPQSDYAMYQKAMIAGIKSSSEKIKILNSVARLYPKSNLLHDIDFEIAQTYIADERFKDAVPYLEKIIASETGGGLKPRAYLKLGLTYYNANENANALKAYQQLIKAYPQSPESEEALSIVKDIYVEEGKPGEYLDLMRQNGINVSVTEADSITFTAALLKYNANDCVAAIKGFNEYLASFNTGGHVLDANFYSAQCYLKSKDWQQALKGFGFVNSKGLSKFFETATLEAARINYFELKDYAEAKKYFQSLLSSAVDADNQLEALRGLVRSYHLLKDYGSANTAAQELLTKKGISTDDRSIAFLVLGKSQQSSNDCSAAINSFKSAAAINKTAWGAEARYEMANCQLQLNNPTAAEKAAMSVIKETGSYDEWVTRSYILLGDIFMKQKDYFNAKATYESVAKNAAIAELKTQAQQKLDAAIAEEKLNSKLAN